MPPCTHKPKQKNQNLKIKPRLPQLPLLLLTLSLLCLTGTAAFNADLTYQGRLEVSGQGAGDPVAPFDFRFKLFDALTGGDLYTVTVSQASVVLKNGLFTVPLDFGTNAFTGPPRWLEIEVRPATNNPTAPTPCSARTRKSPRHFMLSTLPRQRWWQMALCVSPKWLQTP